MVRPARFAFNEETAKNNYFQQKTEQEKVAEKALDEFDAFVNLLRRNDVDVIVMQDTEEPWTPDSIFPNNWFSSHVSGELVLYPMFAENRRQERKPHILDFLRRKMNHPKLINLTSWEEKGEFLEGTGSMIFDRDKRIAYCCRSPRSSEKVLQDFCSRMNFDAVVFDAVDKNGNLIYHTNVMMEVGTQVAVVCLESIKEDEERKKVASRLTTTGKVIVEISPDQVEHFAGNMLELKSRNGSPLMIMSATARKALTTQQEKIISTYNKILSPELATIETNGGGSARCMIAELFY
ncbi:MAG: arginine deiminase-related protein [Petrimonas sp.]|nr:arginine deiminase-related protein [Petrimonas sp.]